MTSPAEASLAEQWAKGHRWHASQAAQRIEVARKCLRLLRSFVSLEDVADFGCGIGAWLAAARALGAGRIAGFEGEWITALTNASDIVLFSAALPGQGGSGHLNEQPLPYWVRKFWRRGYIPLEPIRPYIARDASIFPWIRQNIVAFASYEMALRAPEVMRHARPPSAFSLHHHPGRDLGGF